MRFETTTQRPVEVCGVGLHSGVQVSVRILPSGAGTGIAFVRTDLDGFRVPASWRYVARVSYATSLMRQGVLISTTEHLLSVFYGMGIDNAVVEISSLEAPILDGSGWPWVELLEQAGRRQLRRKRRYLRVRRPVEVRDSGRIITILPAETFRVTCATDFGHPLAGPQEVDLDVTPQNYAREIARARTFGFERDLEQMRDMGLIRGASLENAICFSGEGIRNPGGLRYRDECCRHKVLDLIGDLALIGRPLVGHVIAERAGHFMHTALVAQIMSNRSSWEMVTLDQRATEAARVLVG